MKSEYMIRIMKRSTRISYLEGYIAGLKTDGKYRQSGMALDLAEKQLIELMASGLSDEVPDTLKEIEKTLN